VRFTAEANAFVSKSAGQAASSGTTPARVSLTTMAIGKPDLFLVSVGAPRQQPFAAQFGAWKIRRCDKGSRHQSKGYGLGCAAGDFDNDDHSDLALC